jgi:hypothetical protein
VLPTHRRGVLSTQGVAGRSGSAPPKTAILLALQSEHVSINTIQGVAVGKVNALGGHINGHCRQSVFARVLFLVALEIELFHCTIPSLLLRRDISTAYNTGISSSEEVAAG